MWLPTFTFIFTSYSFRSSDWQIIFKVAILKTLAKLTGKHMWWSPFSTIKGLHQRVFPVNFSKFFIFFTEYLRANGFVLLRLFSILKAITVLFLFAYPKQSWFGLLSKWKLFPVSRSKVFSEIIFPKKSEHS